MKRFIVGVILVSLLAFTPNALADSYGGSYGGGGGGSADGSADGSASINDSAGNGDTTVTYSADKIFDLLALKQALDAELTALAGLTSAANAIPYFTGPGTAGVISSSADMVSLLGSADYAAGLANLGGVDSSGDCTSGACGDGTSDGGSYYEFYHALGNFRLANNAGVAEFQGPAGSGFVAIKALSFTTVKTSGQAGDMAVYEANSTDTHAAGFRGPASITGDGAYRILFPNARAAAAGQVLVVTNAGESGTGTAADPYIQTASWATPVLLSGDNSFTGANTIGDGGDDQRIVSRINSTNERWSGHTIYFAQCAASMGFGQPAYIQSTGKPGLADADGAATMPTIGLVVVASTDADTPCTILTHGLITDTDWNWTVGKMIYVADGDAGAITATLADISDTNDVVQVIGIAVHADSIFVNPSLTTVVLE